MRIDRLTRLALRIVVDAVARAQCGGVERTWGHRLALEHLVRVGLAEAWQARAFWQELAWESPSPVFENNAVIVQTTGLMTCLQIWHQKLDLPCPDPLEMSRLARAYAPDIAFECGTQQHPCMCNRYKPGERDTIRTLFRATEPRAFNEGPAIVHPKDPAWVVRLAGEGHVMEQMTWGFPFYVRGKAGQALKPRPVNNARFDKLDQYWKRWALYPAQRCLIPATRYAEAVGPPGAMTTTWLSVKDTPVFAWAGLWRQSDEWGACYAGVMTDAAPEHKSIHDRAPVILAPEDWHTWLTAQLEDLTHFDRPWPAAGMVVQATDVLWKHGGVKADSNS